MSDLLMLMESLAEEAMVLYHITCRECGIHMDMDQPQCAGCGWVNPLVHWGTTWGRIV
ncbi:MAG: hypothetical protein ACXABY_35045 [Candidatus Thorarchaeota archaeon]|jgi:ribosomal protein L37E